jgi:hypothetical protein
VAEDLTIDTLSGDLTTRQIMRRMRAPTMSWLRENNPPVSRRSRWRSPKWQLDNTTGGLPFVTVDFAGMPAGWRDTARMVVWLAISGTGAVAPRSPATVVCIPSKWRYVFGVIAKFGGTLDEIQPAHFELFIALLRRDLAKADEGAPSETVVSEMLRVWRMLEEQREAFAAAGLPALTFDPYETVSMAARVAGFGCATSDPVLPLPDEVSALLLVGAEAALDDGADALLRLQVRVLDLIERANGVATQEVLEEVRRHISASSGTGAGPRSSGPLATPAAAVLHLKRLLQELEGAAATLLFHEVGYRASEHCSPMAGRNGETGLPSCVERIDIAEEGVSLYLLHATLFKGRSEPVPSVWTLGMTALGANRPPMAARALDVLERLHAPWRGDADTLLVSFHLHADENLRTSSGGPARSREVLKRMRRFMATLDWQALAKSGDRRVRAIAEDRGAGVSSGNFRKSVVNYMVRLDASLLGPCSQQLQHSSEEETDVDYLMNDPTLLERAREFASLEVARLMLHASGAAEGRPTVPERLAPHLADVAAVRASRDRFEWLDVVTGIVASRDLAVPRVHATLAAEAPPAVRAPSLLQKYRSQRRIYLAGRAEGRRHEYRAFAARADAAADQLRRMGIDPPTDEELLGRVARDADAVGAEAAAGDD